MVILQFVMWENKIFNLKPVAALVVELMWIQSLLRELYVQLPSKLSAVALSHNPVLHSNKAYGDWHLFCSRKSTESRHCYHSATFILSNSWYPHEASVHCLVLWFTWQTQRGGSSLCLIPRMSLRGDDRSIISDVAEVMWQSVG